MNIYLVWFKYRKDYCTLDAVAVVSGHSHEEAITVARNNVFPCGELDCKQVPIATEQGDIPAVLTYLE